MSDDNRYFLTHKQALKNLLFVMFLMALVLCSVLSLIISELENDAYMLEGVFIGFVNGLNIRNPL